MSQSSREVRVVVEGSKGRMLDKWILGLLSTSEREGGVSSGDVSNVAGVAPAAGVSLVYTCTRIIARTRF